MGLGITISDPVCVASGYIGKLSRRVRNNPCHDLDLCNIGGVILWLLMVASQVAR